MSFMKPLAQVGTFGLAGLALSKNKKPPPSLARPKIDLGDQSSRASLIGQANRGRY